MLDLETLFNPRRMAVIGATTNIGKWGRLVSSNIMRDNYKGELYLVNRRGGELDGRPFYESAAKIGKEIDLAMIAIPAESVEGVMEDCAAAGVKVAIVISGGFSEASPEGRRREERLLETARRYGIRLVGPNTMGIYSASASLTALMPPVKPRPGHVAFAAQSGNLGTQMLGWGSFRGIGFSRFVCVGNQCDFDFADYLEYFAADDLTKVILLYVEGFKRPRRILELARDISTRKPIIIYKAGETGAGTRAATSHTAAMTGSSEIYRVMIHQAGMIRAETTEEMLDVSDALVKMPLAHGRRVAIVSWGGGWGVVTADLCERSGLKVTPLPDSLREELGSFLPPFWSKNNPVDLVGILDLEDHTRCVEHLARCEEYDAIVSLGTVNAASALNLGEGTLSEEEKQVAEAQRLYMSEHSRIFAQRVTELLEEFGKPVVTVSMPQRDTEEKLDALPEPYLDKLCTYPNPERAARVTAMLVERGEYLHSRGA